jgi:hypothetical protein
MRNLTVCGGRLCIVCPCGFAATGHQPVTVAETMKAHDAFAHGTGLSPEGHALLRATVWERVASRAS